jgi:hypothetical protein
MSLYGHTFVPHPTDPTRCAHRVPSTAPWPAPATEACWGRREDHPPTEGDPL